MKDWIEWFWKEMFRLKSFAIKQQTLFDYRKYTKLDTSTSLFWSRELETSFFTQKICIILRK